MLDTGTTLLLILLGFGVMTAVRGRRVLADYRQFRAWQQAGRPQPVAVSAEANQIEQPSSPAPAAVPSSVDFSTLETTTIPGAGEALLAPPSSLWYSIEYIRERYAHRAGRYTVPLGWRRSPSGRPELVVGHLVGDINMTLLTAMTDGGKDTYILNWLFVLSAMYTPDQLQFVIIDGKGGKDYIGWENKEHVLYLAREDHEIAPAMELMTKLRKQRMRVLRDQAKVSKWDLYDGAYGPMPLVLVVVSELDAMTDAVRKADVEAWLAKEAKSARSDGIRYLVCTQNATGWDTNWRSQMGLRVCGAQASPHHDEPNTGMYPKDIEALNVVAPSKLPDVKAMPGTFLLVQGRSAANVRASHIDDQQRQYWLSRMPERVSANQVVPTLQAAPAFLADLILAGSDTDEDDRSMVDETPLMQGRPLEPVIQEVMLSTQDVPAYDRQALAQVLASSTQKALRTDPVFIQACRDAYRRRGTYRAVIQEFWGSYSGSREETVKAALSQGEGQPTRPREMASAA